MIRSRWLLVLVVVVVALAGCSDSETDAGSTTVPSSTSTTTEPPATTTTVASAPPSSTTSTEAGSSTTTTPAAPPTTERPGPRVVLIAIEIAGGQVTVGEAEYEVERDAVVELIVTSDVTDEVHVHGYDEFIDLTPGATGSVTFTASIPGIFEVELEGSGRLLFELIVS